MRWGTVLLLIFLAVVLVAFTIHMHRGQDIFHGKESLYEQDRVFDPELPRHYGDGRVFRDHRRLDVLPAAG